MILGFITRNWRLKLVAVVLAVVAWVGVVYAANPPGVRSVQVPVPQPPTATIPAGYVIIAPISPLTVSVVGTQDHLRAFSPSFLQVTPDYQAITAIGDRVPATVSVPVTVHNSDRSVQLDNPPTSVRAEVDRTGTKSVDVTVEVGANPPAGYSTGTIQAGPAQVTLTGPEHQIANAEVRTQTVDLANQRGNFDETLKVYAYDIQGQQLSGVNVNPSAVEVQITIEAISTSRTSSLVLGPLRGLAAGYQVTSISYTPLTVTLTGSQDLINDQSLDSVATAPIDLAGQIGTRIYTVAVPSPETGISVNPGTVSVTITVQPIPIPPPTPSSTP